MAFESDAVEMVARLMALSARTAPKARGIDVIKTMIVVGDERNVLAEAMREYGERHNVGFFLRDAGNVAASDACLLIGSLFDDAVGLNCGACGYPTCVDMLEAQKRGSPASVPFRGPNCAVRMTDIGIAVGSAVKTASIHNVDNRVMYSVGVGALSLGWLEGCGVAYGIPLRASGKDIFFDRTR
ncbi:ferredoxin domain-containing protein [Methanoculleus sp.]|uniref:ferredoxin domain-containing protein n=1 Tax=Methanoculleus sp. TaxID=90427 RepID=UPI002FC8CA2F